MSRIDVPYIARVEGKGAINIFISDGELKGQISLYEPPRFFESFLVGRKYDEVMELTSRICGICPVAHQITSLQAVENAMGIEVSKQTEDLRHLLAMSAHIQSHLLSMYFLSLPDFLGYESFISMAKEHKDIAERALRMKKVANDITAIIGGRAVHPVTCIVGGFTTIPSRKKMETARKALKQIKQDALETAFLFSQLKLPDFTRKCEHVALSHQKEYAVNKGKLISTEGLDIFPNEYRKFILEREVKHSNALHSYIKGRDSFMVGPLARINLNFNYLSDDAKEALKESGVSFPQFNPFLSHFARAIEIIHYIDSSIEIIENLPFKEENVKIMVKGGIGSSITEAPRGILYHSYIINKKGIIEGADIVPPTAHNSYNMENDLQAFLSMLHDMPQEEIALKCEMLVRAYDPCISCSVH